MMEFPNTDKIPDWKQAMQLLNKPQNNYLTAVEYNEIHYPSIYDETIVKVNDKDQGTSAKTFQTAHLSNQETSNVKLHDYAKVIGLEVKPFGNGSKSYINMEDKSVVINHSNNTWSYSAEKENYNVVDFAMKMKGISKENAIAELNYFAETGTVKESEEQISKKEILIEENKISTRNDREERQQEENQPEKKKQQEKQPEEKQPEEKQQEKNQPEERKEKVIHRYSSNQLQEIRAGIRTGVDTTLYNDIAYTAEQMKELRLGLEKNIDINSYKTQELKAEQMKELRLGLEKNIDINNQGIEKIKNFSSEQLKQIRLGLENDVDVKQYAHKLLIPEQMKEIRKGLQDKLNVGAYSSPFFNAEQMQKIRKQLLIHKIIEQIKEQFRELYERTRTVFSVITHSRSQETVLQQGNIETVMEQTVNNAEATAEPNDIEDVVEQAVNNMEIMEQECGMEYCTEEKLSITVQALQERIEQMEERLKESELEVSRLKQNLEQDEFACSAPTMEAFRNKNLFNEEQLKEIEIGLLNKTDVMVFAQEKFSAEQMREIRMGLENNVDVSLYADGAYSGKQMEELRLALEKGYDVTPYRNPDISPTQMSLFRSALELNMDPETIKRCILEQIIMQETTISMELQCEM